MRRMHLDMRGLLVALAGLFLLPSCTTSNRHSDGQREGHGAPHWTYEGETGPAHWGDLSPEFILAKTGKKQSPVDINNAVASNLQPITFSYGKTRLGSIVNNGHTIQVNYDAGSSVKLGSKTYSLLQFHFHQPSEHTVKGEHFPMEAHFVHKSVDGELAVVGVLMKSGSSNTALGPVWMNLPKSAGSTTHSDAEFNADAFLPIDRSYYAYEGSLTTPPCSEGVRWNVLKQPVEVSAEQIAKFSAIIDANARPVQHLNGRTIQASR